MKSIKRKLLSKKNKNNLYNLKSLKKNLLRKPKQIGGSIVRVYDEPPNVNSIQKQFNPHFPVIIQNSEEETVNNIKGIIINDNDKIIDDLPAKSRKPMNLRTKIVIFEYDNINFDHIVVEFLNDVINEKDTKVVIVSFNSLNNSIKKKLTKNIKDNIGPGKHQEYEENIINNVLIITPLNYHDTESIRALKTEIKKRKEGSLKRGIGTYNDEETPKDRADKLKKYIISNYNNRKRNLDLTRMKKFGDLPSIVNHILLFYFGNNNKDLVSTNVYYIHNDKQNYSNIPNFNSAILKSRDDIITIKTNLNELTTNLEEKSTNNNSKNENDNKIVLIPLKTLLTNNKIKNWPNCATQILSTLGAQRN